MAPLGRVTAVEVSGGAGMLASFMAARPLLGSVPHVGEEGPLLFRPVSPGLDVERIVAVSALWPGLVFVVFSEDEEACVASETIVAAGRVVLETVVEDPGYRTFMLNANGHDPVSGAVVSRQSS